MFVLGVAGSDKNAPPRIISGTTLIYLPLTRLVNFLLDFSNNAV